MDDINSRKQKANELRKGKNFQSALPIYRELWKESGDKFDGAGLLSCLRSLELFDEAIPLADELASKFPDFNWCKLEVVWTYIQGRLEKLKEDARLDEVIREAERIMKFEPDGFARKKVVFRVLKVAKSAGKWDIASDWLSKLKPEELSKEPIKDDNGREGWCDQSLWHNYNFRCLLEKNRADQVVQTIDQIAEIFPKQKKFFLRYKALAFCKQGKLKDAEDIYRALSSRYPDWWILHEYAKVLRDSGDKPAALKLMCKAASANAGKLEIIVSLLEDIGALLKEAGQYEESQAHFLLSRYIRTSKNWTLKDSLSAVILELKKLIRKDEPASLRDALKICKDCWQKVGGVAEVKSQNRTIRPNLRGNLSLGPQERIFCFINIGNEAFFCSKSDLPKNIQDGVSLTFDALPSFDKKKNKEGWKATNIRI